MISKENQINNPIPHDSDFTVESYCSLVKLAIKNYTPTDYRNILFGEKFILWRHDCDYSLNRSLALAQIEAKEGLRSTFFLNPHCEFYNLLQRDQRILIDQILQLGHDIGLHFDSAFYGTGSKEELHQQVADEADLLGRFLGVMPAAFSFHNPTAFHLTCEADTYGGLVNCYSRYFKTYIPYCSDSNGYWRFRRLYDVLNEATDLCLQVLTHPGWWQEKPMPPRQRIFRSIYGRARATMHQYDQGLEYHGRVNMVGDAQSMQFLKAINDEFFDFVDYLWNTEQFSTLFFELWRLHERQIIRLCKAILRKHWHVSAQDVNALFESADLRTEGWELFEILFDQTWLTVSGSSARQRSEWVQVRNQLVLGRGSYDAAYLQAGCIYLGSVIAYLAEWGRKHALAYDGLSPLSSIGLPTCKFPDDGASEVLEEVKDDVQNFSGQEWEDFKIKLMVPSARVRDNK